MHAYLLQQQQETAGKLSFLRRPNPVFTILKQVSEGCCCSGRKDKLPLLPPALPLTQATSQTEQSVPSTVPSQASAPFAHSLGQPDPITAVSRQPAVWPPPCRAVSSGSALTAAGMGVLPRSLPSALCAPGSTDGTRQINGTDPVFPCEESLSVSMGGK